MDFVICRLFTRLPPVLQVIGHGCVLMYEIWRIFYIIFLKNCLFVEECCEWKTLVIFIVTDTQRRIIAALVIDER